MNGSIDDVRIYSRALSATEISDLYAMGSGTTGSVGTGTGTVVVNSPPVLDAIISSGTTNQPPTVSAGSNQTITLPSTVSLTGTATDDGLPTGSTLANTWSKISGPGTATFANVHSLSTTATFSMAGTYVLRLSSSDTVLTSNSNVTITVNPTPVADIIPQPQVEAPALDTPVPVIVPVVIPTNAEIIGSEALQPFPSSGLWNTSVNFQPDSINKLMVNPPVFSWPWNPTSQYVVNDISQKFWLQVDDDSDFSSPLVNVTTENNMYSYLGPIFTRGQKYYWHVGYLKRNDNAPYTWSGRKSFVIDPNAVSWDRSKLADQSYLQSKIGADNHPYVLFNKNNRKGIYDYLEQKAKDWKANNTQNDLYNAGKSWAYVKGYPDKDIASDWWGKTSSTVALSVRAREIMDVAFVWQLTKEAPAGSSDALLHARIEAANPGQELAYLAQEFINTGAYKEDVVTNSGYTLSSNLGMAYDWLYEIMKDTEVAPQRSQTRKAIEMFLSFVMNDLYYFGGVRAASDMTTWTQDPSTYSGDYKVIMSSLYKRGHSHAFDDFYTAMGAVIAIAGESNMARDFMDFGLNYVITKGSPYNYENGAINEGRLYGSGNAERPLYTNILFKLTFPEVQFEKNPYLTQGSDWWSRFLPVGFTEMHQPWGDGGNAGDQLMSSVGYGRDAAFFLQDGNIANHWKEAYPYPTVHSAILAEGLDLVLPYYYSLPTLTIKSGQL